jgi:hypothetical protein
MIQFKAIFNRATRDSEDATKVIFECDCQQIDMINLIPAQKLLDIKIEVEDEE